jgi:hypothetical protein
MPEEQTNTEERVNLIRFSDRDKHPRRLRHVSPNAGSDIIFAAMPLKLREIQKVRVLRSELVARWHAPCILPEASGS